MMISVSRRIDANLSRVTKWNDKNLIPRSFLYHAQNWNRPIWAYALDNDLDIYSKNWIQLARQESCQVLLAVGVCWLGLEWPGNEKRSMYFLVSCQIWEAFPRIWAQKIYETWSFFQRLWFTYQKFWTKLFKEKWPLWPRSNVSIWDKMTLNTCIMPFNVIVIT